MVKPLPHRETLGFAPDMTTVADRVGYVEP